MLEKNKKQVYEIHVHIHEDHHKQDRILEAIEHWHEAEIDDIIKQLKKTIKDIKRTPVK